MEPSVCTDRFTPFFYRRSTVVTTTLRVQSALRFENDFGTKSFDASMTTAPLLPKCFFTQILFSHKVFIFMPKIYVDVV